MTAQRAPKTLAACALAIALASPLAGATPPHVLALDATAQPAPPETGYLKQGSATSPSGRVLGINSRYLTLDGTPWLPVMGEFHYTRFPARYWEEQLRKMKAAGVSIVSTYVMWNMHEVAPGQFDWTGDRDLRRFVTLCQQIGLYVFLRPGPWAHAELRFGGIPDWVMRAMPTRRNDPAYLDAAGRFYRQIGAQVKGLLWKDGGPIIGAQVENEYNLTGPGEGRAHIAALKSLLLQAGIDVPLYTVTGWDNTVYPKREVTPVFGGYPDEPWDRSTGKLPAKALYAFQFDSRVEHGLGAQTAADGAGDAESDAPHTPFLAAEFGGGVPTMYRRRPIIAPDDVAAMLPVQLGSGVNLYGYYMFQGGRNPEADPSLQESTAIGGYNDLPMIGYDFGAPLGEYGQAHPVLAKLRPFHAFLQSWGSTLAPMVAHRPDVMPTNPADLKTPRFAVRSLGDHGFLFVNNHVRGYGMAAQQNVAFSIALPGGTLQFPSRPVTIPTDAYFIWPINLDLGGATLAWATAQPLTRLPTPDGELTVLQAIPGIGLELAFNAADINGVSLNGRQIGAADGRGHWVVDAVTPGTSALLTITPRTGRNLRLLVLTQAQAEQSWVAPLDGADRLILTDAQLFTDTKGLKLRATGTPDFRLGILPPLSGVPRSTPALAQGQNDGAFQTFRVTEPTGHCQAEASPLRQARPVPKILIGGPAQAAVEPTPPVFGDMAAWTITITPDCLAGLTDAYLRISYQGDVARLFAGVSLLDDAFYTGQDWEIGLKRYADILSHPLTLAVLPLRQDAPIYLAPGQQPVFAPDGQVARLSKLNVVPEYGLSIAAGR